MSNGSDGALVTTIATRQSRGTDSAGFGTTAERMMKMK